MSGFVIAPVLVPLLAAGLSLLFWRWEGLQRVVGVLGGAGQLAASLVLLFAVEREGVLALTLGGWPAPFGITLVADMTGAIMVVLTGLMGFAVAIYSLVDIDRDKIHFGYFPLYHVLLTGVAGAFLTGDVFNLYVFFEVMLIASFVLLALGGERFQMEGAIKYVTLNLVSSMLFLMAAGLLYGTARTLNMAHLSERLPEIYADHPALVLTISAFFVVSFGIKAGVFPLYFWLPASYHTPPTAVSAVFAGLLTKVGVYALIRINTTVFPDQPLIFGIVLAVAGLTMMTGVLGAVSQFEIRRILSFHIISQIGYMVMGVGLLVAEDPETRRLALAAAVFYITHHIIVKTNLFLVGGVVRQLQGSFDLKKTGGLIVGYPLLALLFLIPALSLAGIPPLSGFWAKLGMIRAGIEAGAWWVVAAAIAAGLLTLVSMIKIWNEAFWKKRPEDTVDRPLGFGRGFALVAPIVLLALCTLAIGLAPQPFFTLAERAADELMDTSAYVAAVDLATAEIADAGGGTTSLAPAEGGEAGSLEALGGAAAGEGTR